MLSDYFLSNFERNMGNNPIFVQDKIAIHKAGNVKMLCDEQKFSVWIGLLIHPI